MSIETMPEKSLDDVKGDARQAEYEAFCENLSSQMELDELVRIFEADQIVDALPEAMVEQARIRLFLRSRW